MNTEANHIAKLYDRTEQLLKLSEHLHESLKITNQRIDLINTRLRQIEHKSNLYAAMVETLFTLQQSNIPLAALDRIHKLRDDYITLLSTSSQPQQPEASNDPQVDKPA